MPRGAGVLVTLTASRSGQVARLDDELARLTGVLQRVLRAATRPGGPLVENITCGGT